MSRSGATTSLPDRRRAPPALLPRRPKIDLEGAPIIWSRIPEISHFWHGASISAPIVEQYLVKCMNIATTELGNADRELKGQVELFIKQESNHFNFHKLFNKRLRALDCKKLEHLEQEFAANFRDFIKERTLDFNLAYCAGFENFSMYSALFVFGPGQDIFDGSDKRGADLFLWHLAEEFEHRALCHDVFGRISGNYFMRVYGILFSFWHLNMFIARASSILMTAHRKGMSSTDFRQSVKSEKAFKRRFARFVIPRIFLLFLPYYNPLWYSSNQRINLALDDFALAT